MYIEQLKCTKDREIVYHFNPPFLPRCKKRGTQFESGNKQGEMVEMESTHRQFGVAASVSE